MSIKQPLNTSVLRWKTDFARKRNAQLVRKQKFVDSAVLEHCSPLTPKKTGNLINSGTRGTIIGSGEVRYLAPYSNHQYYNTAESRPNDPNRGSHWFERMKTAHKREILEGADKI